MDIIYVVTNNSWINDINIIIKIKQLFIKLFITRMEKLKVNSIQNFVEKGLQSQNLSDVLITITECGRCIQDNPFPNFMHSTLLRLAQAFHGEVFARKFEHSMNTIRLRIVTAIRECSPSLRLNFSLSEEIVRIIMKVSHSNDYKARALTLLLLASLAPMLSEDKKIHNLVIESLDCNESIELSAAIHAANELAKFSMSFPSLIIRKIAEMFGQNQLSNSMKIQLFEIISNLRDLTVAKNCIDLGKALLDRPADEKMHMTVYNSLTHLACCCSTILPDQISILLSELSKNVWQKNKILVHCVLRNLSKIASQQQYWTQENVETFCNFYASILSLASKGILCNWLHCLEVLSSAESHQFPILNEKHPWSTLLASPCIVVRIFAIKISHNLLQNGGINKQFRDKILESISKTLFHFIREPQSNSRIRRESRFEFLLLLSNFVRSTKCLPEFAISICKLILEAKLTEQNKDLFELLAVVSETYWDKCQQIVSSILIDEIGKNQNLEEIPSIVFTLLFLTTPINSFASAAEQNRELLSDFANRLLSHPHFDHWSLYKIARSALRSGHLRLIALPLLQRIQKSCENMETASWIDGLIHICQTQPTSFSVKELSKYESGLQNAALNFKALASTGKSQPFTFAADYANCLQLTFAAIRSILITINIKLMGASSVNNSNSSEFQRKSIIQSLSLVRNMVVDARQHWVTLCSKSFDADNQTLLMSGLMIRQCLLLEEFLAILCEQKREKRLSEILIEDLGENGKNFRPNAQTLNFHMLLTLARTQLLQISNADNDLILNLKMLREILRTLSNFQLGLPRFFFQRIQSTRIKLIISPQPPDGRTTVRVNSVDLLPLIVEGIVESNNHKSIESVCVVLTLKRENAAATEKKQNVQFESTQKYFRAQFLLKIHQKTKISAKVWFVDAVAKKQWFDESDSVSLMVELMDT